MKNNSIILVATLIFFRIVL